MPITLTVVYVGLIIQLRLIDKKKRLLQVKKYNMGFTAGKLIQHYISKVVLALPTALQL